MQDLSIIGNCVFISGVKLENVLSYKLESSAVGKAELTVTILVEVNQIESD